MTMIKKILIVIVASSLIGCASKTVDLKPDPPSETRLAILNSYNCNQISNKLTYLEKKAQRVARIQNDNAHSDRVLVSWGWLLYGIPYLWLDGDGETKMEFESILGEIEALENIAIQKDCKFERINYQHTYDGKY